MNFPFVHYTSKDEKRRKVEVSLIQNASWIAALSGFCWDDIQQFQARRTEEQSKFWNTADNPQLAAVIEQKRKMTKNAPQVNEIILPQLIRTLAETYPQVQERGFDLVVWFKPRDGLNLLTPLVGQYDFYILTDDPTSSIGSTGENIGFPNCRLIIPVNPEDKGIRLGILDSLGIATPQAHATLLADTSNSIVDHRMMAIEQTHREWHGAAGVKPAMLQVPEQLKFRFLNFALMNLMMWWCRANQYSLPQVVKVSDQRKIDRVTEGGERILTAPDPRLEVGQL